MEKKLFQTDKRHQRNNRFRMAERMIGFVLTQTLCVCFVLLLSAVHASAARDPVRPTGHMLSEGEGFQGTATASAEGSGPKSLPCMIQAGAEVTLTYRPPEHYRPSGIRVRYQRENGTAGATKYPVFPKTDGSYTVLFTMPDSDASLVADLVAEISTWSDLQKKIDSTENGGTVTLYGDIRASAGDPFLRIRKDKDVSIDLNGYALDRNLTSAAAEGYAILIESGAKLTLTDGSRNGGGRVTGGISKNGGGIYCAGTLDFQGGTVTGNRATEKGGGIYVDGGTLTVTGGSISGNRADKDGGGLFLIHKTGIFHANFSGCAIEDNTASGNGGGICVDGYGELNLTDTKVRNNSAATGGGISIKSGFSKIENTEISGNKSSSSGGGLYVGSIADCTLSSSAISRNESSQKAGGIAVEVGGRLSLNVCTVSENKASVDGGGIYVGNAGAVELDGCGLTGNEAAYGGGIYLIAGREIFVRFTDMTNNRARTNGGALWMGDAKDTKADFMNCRIERNESAQNGGAFYARGKGALLLTNCRILANTAKSGTGGAAYTQGLGLTFGLIGSEVQNNTAASCGGIYLKNATVSLKGLVDVSNNSSSGEGKNLVLADSSLIVNPGLYDGSYVSVYAKNSLVAAEISEYQTRYLHIENKKNGDPLEKDFQKGKTVETPLFASVFGSAGLPVIIGVGVLGTAGVATAVIVKKKKKKNTEKEEKEDGNNDR